jgi:hypothetical protein
MNGGLKIALLVSGLALGGCSTVTHEVKVRPLDPEGALKSGSDELGTARAELALNNVGFALEAFRNAHRAMPSDPAAVAGIGDCYAAMGRFDIAESSYEFALSLAPRDHALLLGLASILERAGKSGRASDIRAEAERFNAASQLITAKNGRTQGSQNANSNEAKTIAASIGSITVELPPARPARLSRREAIRVPMPAIALDDHLSPGPADVALADPRGPRRPSTPPTGEASFAIEQASPRLERLSRGEIALVTTTKTLWVPPARDRMTDDSPAKIDRSLMASNIHWSPLIGKGSVQVLNAAGAKGLAASARTILSGRGWRSIAIGDASALRHSSVVFYPKGRAALGRRLAAQFGVTAHMVQTDRITLLLGRDVAARMARSRKA